MLEVGGGSGGQSPRQDEFICTYKTWKEGRKDGTGAEERKEEKRGKRSREEGHSFLEIHTLAVAD